MLPRVLFGCLTILALLQVCLAWDQFWCQPKGKKCADGYTGEPTYWCGKQIFGKDGSYTSQVWRSSEVDSGTLSNWKACCQNSSHGGSSSKKACACSDSAGGRFNWCGVI